MVGRTIAIGDIHGCSAALSALLAAVAPARDDTVVVLGDMIDRGPDSRGVLAALIELSRRCRLVTLIGNHEERLADALRDTANLKKWLASGGTDTLRSYGWSPGGPRRHLSEWFPTAHRAFLAECRPYFETPTHIFLHAGYVAELPLHEQPGLALRWRVTDAQTARPHVSVKMVVVGHTPQLTGEVLNLGFLVCIDTNCARGGWLTAFDASSGRVWQADARGAMRA